MLCFILIIALLAGYTVIVFTKMGMKVGKISPL